MKRTLTSIAAISAVSLLASGCGLNPFGPSQGGLSLFANIGKAMQKPSAINDNQNSKDGTKTVISAGGTAKQMLAKMSATSSAAWLDSNGIADNGNGTFTYWEVVTNKPAEEDAQNLMTGRGEVVFKYNGSLPTVSTVNTALITDLVSFHFFGKENKTWRNELDTLDLSVHFSSTAIGDVKPGLTRAWGRNISATLDEGQGDTAMFALDSLDDVNHVSFGEGHFLDAHTGDDNSGDSYAFNFAVKVFYKDSLNPNTPYARWKDNEGEVTFVLPWGKNATDSLHFDVHFYPDYERAGTISDDNGVIRVQFEHNEKSLVGWVKYFDKDGKEIK